MLLAALVTTGYSPALHASRATGRTTCPHASLRQPPAVSRRALLPLPFLLAAGAPPAFSADFNLMGPDISFDGGKAKVTTEMEARDALTKKVQAATEAGKGLDVERRGQFNEKALFSEDFYFKYGLRPTPAEVLNSPFLPPQADLPFAPVQRRYTGYQKYKERIQRGTDLYTGTLRTTIQKGAWAEIPELL